MTAGKFQPGSAWIHTFTKRKRQLNSKPTIFVVFDLIQNGAVHASLSVHTISTLLICESDRCWKMHMGWCALLCVLQLLDEGPLASVLSRQPGALELTCVPISTVVTLLTCSPASPAPLPETPRCSAGEGRCTKVRLQRMKGSDWQHEYRSIITFHIRWNYLSAEVISMQTLKDTFDPLSS